MEKCYFSKKYRMERWINLIGYLFLSLILAGLAAAVFSKEPGNPAAVAMLLVPALVLFVYGALFVLFLFREYAIDENGITIQYVKRFRVFYPWDSIRKICLCEVHQGKVDSVKSDVIWCSVGEKRKEPPIMPRIYHEIEYEFFHFRTILTMEYTPERLAAFQNFCHREIPDYREQMHRRIF